MARVKPKRAIEEPESINKSKKKIVFLTISLVLLFGAVSYFGFYLFKANNALNSITRSDLLPSRDDADYTDDLDRTVKYSDGKPLNILIIGSDKRPNASVEDDSGRSDTLMIAHVPADRTQVFLISIPRDSYVDMPGFEYKNKINAAYSEGGAELTTETVEMLLGNNIDNVVVIDFDGFVGLVDAIGGVTVDNPYEACDTSQNVCWESGPQLLDSPSALKYVRWRYGLPNGDITRTENQQRVVKAIVNKILSRDVLTDLSKLTNLLDELGEFVTVDNTLTNDKIVDIALSMRINSGSDIKSIVLPIEGYKDFDRLGSVNLVDEDRLSELKHSLYTDTVEEYWLAHKNDPIAGISTVEDINSLSKKDDENDSFDKEE